MTVKLEVKNLQCVRQQKTLFQQLDFVVQESSVLAIEGPNGSGKSSLLRLLTGMATPADGEITWCGQPIQRLKADYWRHMHYCGHSNGLKSGLTVAENLQLTQYLCQMPDVNPEAVLREFNLHQDLHTHAQYLSAGQKRRAALAKLFLYPKKLWLLDEPLTALDRNAQELFLSKLHQHLQAGGMAVISSHHPLPLTGVQHLRLRTC